MDFNFHGSPFQLHFKCDSRSVKMTGSFLLNWSAFLIFFITITQSKSECFFSAVSFAMDPPYKGKIGMQNLFIAGIFSVTFVLYIFATSRPLLVLLVKIGTEGTKSISLSPGRLLNDLNLISIYL